MKPNCLAAALVALAWLSQPHLRVHAIEHYYFSNLGAINNTGEIAKSITRDGLILIGTRNGGGNFLFDGTTRWDLTSLVGVENQFLAYDINDDGIIVGRMVTKNGTEFHAAALIKTLTADRFGTNLVDLNIGSTNSVAVSINNDGNLVGTRIDGDVPSAFRGSIGGSFTVLPPNFTPARIGVEGHIAGSVTVKLGDNLRQHAAILFSGGPLEDLGTLPGRDPLLESHAVALNRIPGLAGGIGGVGGGKIVGSRIGAVGWSGTDTRFDHAFLWDVGAAQDLDIQPHPEREGTTMARGLNRYGEIVGIVDPLFQHACIFRDDVVINLNFAFPKGIFLHNALGWTLQTADAINEFGQIAGWANRQGVQVEAYILTPARIFVEEDGDEIALSWVRALTGFSVETTTTPEDSNSWKPVPGVPVDDGPLFRLEIATPQKLAVFRLTGPGL